MTAFTNNLTVIQKVWYHIETEHNVGKKRTFLLLILSFFAADWKPRARIKIVSLFFLLSLFFHSSFTQMKSLSNFLYRIYIFAIEIICTLFESKNKFIPFPIDSTQPQFKLYKKYKFTCQWKCKDFFPPHHLGAGGSWKRKGKLIIEKFPFVGKIFLQASQISHENTFKNLRKIDWSNRNFIGRILS